MAQRRVTKMRLHRYPYRLLSAVLLVAAAAWSQQVALQGLRSLNHDGAFHGLKQDAAGNLYTVFDAHDGLRVYKFNAAGTQLLAQAQLGQAGDDGIALDVDAAGNVYVTGTSNSRGSIAGTAGTAFPNKADTTTNSFVARLTPALTLQWLTFCGSGRLAAVAVGANATQVIVTGSIFAATLPVTAGGLQQSPAPSSVGNGFVESFNAATGTLQYSTYVTGANGDTAPASIAVDAGGHAYIAGTTTATGFPTSAALVPVFRATAGNNVSGFVTELTPAGDGFVFSTFVPGNGLTSVALDANALLLAGDVASGLFPVGHVQSPIAPLLRSQTAVRLALDGTVVQSSTLLGPGTQSLIVAGPNGTAWVFGSTQNAATVPLLPFTTVETTGNAFAVRIAANGLVDRAARIGALPTRNSGFASIPVTEGGIVVAADGSATLAASIAPTLSSALLATEQYDFDLVATPNAALPSTLRDALPLSTCNGSACAGSAGLLTRLAPDAASPSLSLSIDTLPNLTLRNLGTAAASGTSVIATGYTLTNTCGTVLSAGAACSLVVTGAGPGSVTATAANALSRTIALPANSAVADVLAVLPRELDFGLQTATSATGTRTLTVTNLTATTQTFSSQTLSNTPTAYTVAETSSDCLATGSGTSKIIGPNGTCHITLGLTASTDATKDGVIAAHWQVGTAEILLTGYAQAATETLSSTTIDFGRQFVGGLRAPRYLYLSNGGDTPQSHNAVMVPAGAFMLVDECPDVLQPRSVCRIDLTYAAAAAPSSDAQSLNIDGIAATVLGETLPQPAIGGASVNPNLSVTPASAAFALAVTATTASTETQTITVSNTGAAPIALSLAIAGDFTFATSCPATLAANTGCTATITFTPSSAGTRQGLFSVTANNSSPVYVELSGTGTAVLPLNNGLISFGDVPLNTPSVQWFKVSQPFTTLQAASSSTAYGVILVEDTGYGHGQPAAAAFAQQASGTCSNCYLGVQFLPLATGPQFAVISLTSAAAGKPDMLLVSGNGAALNGVLLSPITRDFGAVPVSSSTASTLFLLTNGTNGAVSISGSTATGDFTIANDLGGGTPCVGTVAPGAACFVPIRFSPTATGTRTGTVTVTTAAGNATLGVSGTGSQDPGIAFTPGELVFTNVPGGAATQQTITMRNTGTGPATVATPSVTDTHFSVAHNCATLAPSATCTLTINFVPSASPASGTLNVGITTSPAGAASSTTYALALAGRYTTQNAGLQILPGNADAVNFGATTTGTVGVTRVLHVNNLTTTPLTLSVESPRQFAVNSATCAAIAANAGCDLSVTYTPLTAADTTGTIFVSGTQAGGGAVVTGLGYLEGYGTGSGSLAITGNISPAGIVSFGQVASGSSASQTLTLTNPISATATVTPRRIRSDFPYYSTTTCGAPLAPGQSCTVTVLYSPVFQATTGSLASPETDNGVLTVESDAANSPQFVDLAGQAAAAYVAAPSNTAPLATYVTSQGSLTFAATSVGSASAPQSILLTNDGTRTLHIIGLLTPISFRATSDCGTLVAGAFCTVNIVFAPQAAGTVLGAVEIQSDGNASLEFISLLGNAGAASVSLQPQSLDFGRVLVGRSASLLATLTNTGPTPVTLGAVSFSSNFSPASSTTAANPCPAAGNTLPASSSCTLAIVFTPTAVGTARGIVSVATSATPLPLSIALSGVGTSPQLTATPGSLSFGNVALGSTASLSLTLNNVSTLPVDGLAFTATTDFSVSSNCGITTLSAGSACSLSVTYKPTTIGLRAGTLTIASNDPASPILVQLAGNGIQGGSFTLTVDGGSTSTQTVVTGLEAHYALSLSPTGGFSGAVVFTCDAALPVAYAACSVSPSTVTLLSGAQASTATITTVTAIPVALNRSAGGVTTLLCILLPSTMIFFVVRRRIPTALLVTLCALTLLSGGCGSGGDPRIRYVAPGNYSFRVTASSTSSIPASQTVTLNLTVLPKS